MNYDTFKDRLKVVLGGESNTSFAKKCDLAEGTIRRYLRSEAFPPLDTLEKIAVVSGYSLAWLASGEGPMKLGDHPAAGSPARETTLAAQAPYKHVFVHDWLEEELQNKTISEVMTIVTKFKTVLDEQKGG
jgi:transcriptional regulator with XRE-family HTH domain